MCSVGNRASTFCEKPLAVILSLWLTACKYTLGTFRPISTGGPSLYELPHGRLRTIAVNRGGMPSRGLRRGAGVAEV